MLSLTLIVTFYCCCCCEINGSQSLENCPSHADIHLILTTSKSSSALVLVFLCEIFTLCVLISHSTFLSFPQVFNVAYFRQGSTSNLVYGAKGVGEPPLFMAVSVVNAIRECVMSARTDAGLAAWADVSLPVTPARACAACAVDVTKLSPDLNLWNEPENVYSNAKPLVRADDTSSKRSLTMPLVLVSGLVLAGAFFVHRHLSRK